MSTVTSTTTSVDSTDSIEVGLPQGAQAAGRPWVRIPNDVFVTMPIDADTDAAEWWRKLAKAAEVVAAWYDTRLPAGGAR